MGIEIERKFLVKDNSWKEWCGHDCATIYTQGYLFSDGKMSVRIRLAGEKGYLTIKGKAVGLSRAEFEYEIPEEDARNILFEMPGISLIQKTRFKIPVGGHVWEVDQFHNDNYGLVVAEIELREENEAFIKPDWVGNEVSNDPKYLNTNLATHPYNKW